MRLHELLLLHHLLGLGLGDVNNLHLLLTHGALHHLLLGGKGLTGHAHGAAHALLLAHLEA
jgi:hypothetical protein